jgi:hypothetical protein
VVNLDDPTRKGGPGPTDVESGGVVANVFFHAPRIAYPVRPRSSRGYKTGDSPITRAYGSAPNDIPDFDTDSYQQKYNTTNP